MARPALPAAARRCHEERVYLSAPEVARLDLRRGDLTRSEYLAAPVREPYDLRAMTVQQPWASLLVQGRKPWENRPRDPGVRPGGQWVAVHAGLTLHPAANRARALAPDLDLEMGPRGAIIGLVWMEPAIPAEQVSTGTEWASGPLCIPCSRALAFERPIPARGMLGLWRVPRPVVDQIEALVGTLG